MKVRFIRNSSSKFADINSSKSNLNTESKRIKPKSKDGEESESSQDILSTLGEQKTDTKHIKCLVPNTANRPKIVMKLNLSKIKEVDEKDINVWDYSANIYILTSV
jgi:hypothetical protein